MLAKIFPQCSFAVAALQTVRRAKPDYSWEKAAAPERTPTRAGTRRLLSACCAQADPARVRSIRTAFTQPATPALWWQL